MPDPKPRLGYKLNFLQRRFLVRERDSSKRETGSGREREQALPIFFSFVRVRSRRVGGAFSMWGGGFLFYFVFAVVHQSELERRHPWGPLSSLLARGKEGDVCLFRSCWDLRAEASLETCFFAFFLERAAGYVIGPPTWLFLRVESRVRLAWEI
jgi:hypothetical protein